MISHAEVLALRWIFALSLATLLLSTSVFVGVRCDGIAVFLVVVVVTIVTLCSLSEWLIPLRLGRSFWTMLFRGGGRGGCIGITTWLALMFAISQVIEAGSEFQAYAVFLSPLALAGGAIAGAIARAITLRSKRLEGASSS
jgi:hypothetical protein